MTMFRQPQSNALRYAATLLTWLALACGGDDPVRNTAAIQIAVGPDSMEVSRGTSASVTVSLTRVAGAAQGVTLSATGAPQGTNLSFTPSQLVGSQDAATIDLAVGTITPVGSYTIAITATAVGLPQATATFKLTVTADPSYTLLVAPSALAIAVDDHDETTVAIDRTSFTGEVAFTLANPPAGITGAFDPTPTATNASTLAVTVGGTVAPGNYTLTVRGTATGLADRTTTLQLTVLPASTGANNVEYQFCDPMDVPLFIAYQDGAGAWQALSGSSAGGITKFAFKLAQGHGGVLMVFPVPAANARDAMTAPRPVRRQRYRTRTARSQDGPGARFDARARSATSVTANALGDTYETILLYGSTAEMAQDGIESCVPTLPDKTISLDVAGVQAPAYATISFGYSTHAFFGGTSMNPLTFQVPVGSSDLAGSLFPMLETPPNKLILLRNLDVPDGGSLASPVDFNSSAASVPLTASIAITGGAENFLQTYVTLVTATSHVGVWSFVLTPPSEVGRWAGFSSAVMQSGDFHGLSVFAAQSGETGDYRVAGKYVGPVSDQTISLGPVLSAASASEVAAGPYPRFRFQGPLSPEYDKGVIVSVLDEQRAGNPFLILASGAWLAASGGSLAFDLSMPDVSGLPGFPTAARLTPGTNDVTIESMGFTGPGLFELRPSLGGEFRSAFRHFSIVVP